MRCGNRGADLWRKDATLELRALEVAHETTRILRFLQRERNVLGGWWAVGSRGCAVGGMQQAVGGWRSLKPASGTCPRLSS